MMNDEKDTVSNVGEVQVDKKDTMSEPEDMPDAADTEDIPSDFFDDFSKDDFMKGLSVIDECWDEAGPGKNREHRARINREALDSVSDLRELIGDSNDDSDRDRKNSSKGPQRSSYKLDKSSPSEIDNFIKPGSRRDPSKTNEAIKKDKEVKVQQYLAKTLESSDDLRPPGTELDDYYEAEKKEPPQSQQHSSLEKSQRERSASPQRRSPRQRMSPRPRRSPRQRYSPRMRFSPGRHYVNRRSPPFKFRPHYFKPYNNFVHQSAPYRKHYSPPRRSPGRRSPGRRSPPRRSPGKHSPYRRNTVKHSPGRYSPRRTSRSPRRHRSRSRSPRRRNSRRSRSRSPSQRDNSFLYPNTPGYPVGNVPYTPEVAQPYAPPMPLEYPGSVPGYSFTQAPAYGGGFSDPYNYGVSQTTIPVSTVNPVPGPSMVPAPKAPSVDKATPYDALAQLVAEGKISQEDYLKLTPNKGLVPTSTMDTKTRVTVLTRCTQALSKLDKLLVPNRLVINGQVLSGDDRFIAPKYCSPLKRQGVAEFSFTKGLLSPAQQTKQLVDSIMSTLGLDKVSSKFKNKLPKNMKDSSIQTTKSQCDVCEIRQATKYRDVSTSTEPEYFTSTVHTQVVEQDLISSKSIFNPTGSASEGAPMSIAHMTPAQLVSQLAARAKTLKQPQDDTPPQNQYSRRPPPNYDYDHRGQQYQHHPYNNYRY